MGLHHWSRHIADHIEPDATEILAHAVKLSIVLGVEVLFSFLLHSAYVPRELADKTTWILDVTIQLTLWIFGAASVVIYAINACAMTGKRLNEAQLGRGGIAFIVLIVGVFVFRVADNSPHRQTTGDPGPERVLFALDRIVTRGPTHTISNTFFLAPKTELVELAFFVPICDGCRYVALLDDGNPSEVVSRDVYGNFIYTCAASRMQNGAHELHIVEIARTPTRESPRSFTFTFEVAAP